MTGLLALVLFRVGPKRSLLINTNFQVIKHLGKQSAFVFESTLSDFFQRKWHLDLVLRGWRASCLDRATGLSLDLD